MIFGSALSDDDSAQEGVLDRIQLPWLDSLGKTAANTFIHNPLSLLRDLSELSQAQNPQIRGFEGEDPSMFLTMNPEAPGADAEFVDPKTLNAEYGQSLGMTFDRPTRRGAVSIMVRRKQEEIQRNAYLERAPDGVAFGIANFATMLAVSAVDPLNVASAFIPVVSQARAAMWTARMGKTLGRARTGITEGVAGAAIIEPGIYAASNYLGDDYDMGDSLLNVAVGGVLGGGLHVGFGAISDHFSRLAPETREASLRGAIANMAEGRPVQVDHIIGTDPVYRRFDELPVIDGLRLSADEARLQATDADLTAQLSALAPGDPKAVEIMARLEAVERQLADEGLDVPTRKQLSTRRDELLTDTTPERLREAAKPIEDRRGLENQQARVREEMGAIGRKKQERAVQAALTPPGITAAAEAAAGRFRDVAGRERPDPVALAAMRSEGDTALTMEADRQSAGGLDRARTASQAYGRNREPSTAVPPREVSARADQMIREAQGDDLDAELQEAMATIDAFEKQGALTPEEAAAARTGRELIQKAGRDGKAAQAAARCLLLHP